MADGEKNFFKIIYIYMYVLGLHTDIYTYIMRAYIFDLGRG